MNVGAGFFMALSWISVVALTVFCFYRVFTTDRDGKRASRNGKE